MLAFLGGLRRFASGPGLAGTMVMDAEAPPIESFSVSVVADSRETIDGLQQYFQGAGIPSTAARVLLEVTLVPSAATALVLFPDEFHAEEVIGRISSLRVSRPDLLIVVVTNAPQRITEALKPDRDSLVPIVLSKPAFGWTILDSIREHLRSEAP